MSRDIHVTVLVENTARGKGLLAEHGLSYWIRVGERHLLFDTGQGMVLPINAPLLGVPMERIEAVALSHGHYDHSGGLAFAVGQSREVDVYAHPGAFDRKYARSNTGAARDVGIPLLIEKTFQERVRNVIPTKQPVEIFEGLSVTGEIPRVTDFEDTGGPFFLNRECTDPDPLLDDRALFFESPDGIVVILGCAHAGVVNTLEYIQKLTGGKSIHTVIGGMHLVSATNERMDRTIDAFREFGIQRLAPAHCTGFDATMRLGAEFPGRCFSIPVGAVLDFDG